MGVKITGKFIGDKKVKLTHSDSGATLITAPPKDNTGDGSSFSPTDLVAGSLGACMMTIMSIMAERDNVSLNGMHMEVEKIMSTTSPRRIDRLPLNIFMPKELPLEYREKLERGAKTCPVHHSLHPDIIVEVKFEYTV